MGLKRPKIPFTKMPQVLDRKYLSMNDIKNIQLMVQVEFEI